MATTPIQISGVAGDSGPGAVQEIAAPKCSGAPRIRPKGGNMTGDLGANPPAARG